MKRKLTIKARADLDVVEHYEYLLARNPNIAARFRHAIKAAYKRIGKDPRSCARIEHFNELELRFCRPAGFRSHLIVFQVIDDQVLVVRVLHSSQDLASALHGS